MTVSTTELSLLKGQDSDNSNSYLKTSLANSLDIVDALFHTSSGHDHSGAHKGAPVTRAASLTTTGRVGVGTAPATDSTVMISGSLTAGIVQRGLFVSNTAASDATSAYVGLAVSAATAATVFTCANFYDAYLSNPSKGAGSIITSAYGLNIEPINVGSTNNYGIVIGAPSGGGGVNYGLYNHGSTVLEQLLTVSNGIVLNSGDFTFGNSSSGTQSLITADGHARFRMQDQYTLGNTNTRQALIGVANPNGIVFVVDNTDGSVGIFGTSGVVTGMIGSTGSAFSATSGNPTTTNLYVTASTLTIQNNRGSTHNYVVYAMTQG
jgi:hypothetical protein